MREKYNLDETVFDTIDTEEKAYWIGFLWGDGYVADKSTVKNNRTSILIHLALQERDTDHLVKFQKFMKADYPIVTWGAKTSFDDNTMMSRISFSSSRLGRNLMDRYDIVPHRTTVDNLRNEISEPLMRHFIRGLYDADGSMTIYYNKGKHLKSHIAIMSPEKLLVFIQDYLVENRIVKSKTKFYKRHKERDGDTKEVRVCGNQQVKNMLEWLYEDATIYMDRKYEKFIELQEKMKKRD